MLSHTAVKDSLWPAHISSWKYMWMSCLTTLVTQEGQRKENSQIGKAWDAII